MFRRFLGGARHTAEDDGPSTEPLQTMVAALQGVDANHTAPVARSTSLPRAGGSRLKKPRVSFNTVTSTTFVKDGDDPFRFSSPQTHELSPLVDSSLSFEQQQATDEDDDVAEPKLGSLTATAAAVASVSTPVRAQRINNTEEPEFESPCAGGSPSEIGDPTGEVGDISKLVHEDEMQRHGQESRAPSLGLPSPAPSSWNDFAQFKKEHGDGDRSAAPSPNTRKSNGSVEEKDKVLLAWMYGDLHPSAHSDPARWSTKKSFDLTVAELEAQNSGLQRPVIITEYGLDDDDERREFKVSSVEELTCAYQDSAMQIDSEIQNASGSAGTGIDIAMAPASIMQASPRTSLSTQGTIDFAALNDEFDERVGLAGSPLAQDPLRASGDLGLLTQVALGSSPIAAIGNRLPARSPKQDFATWVQGAGATAQSPRGLGSGSLPASSSVHPIQQLTGGHSSISGPRTRIGWDEFVNHCNLQVMNYDNQAAAPRADTSALGASNVEFRCPRVQELHESLQHRRAGCLEQFVEEIAQDVEQNRNAYAVDKQMWDCSVDMPAVARELIQLLPQAETLAHDKFIMNIKEWHQHCKDEALLKWYATKRRWLEQDVEITRQHTQELSDEVQRLYQTTRDCKAVSNELRNSSKHMQHVGDLHDIERMSRDVGLDVLRRTQEECQLIQRKVTEEQTALEADKQTNEELARQIEELKQRTRCEQLRIIDAHKATLRQQLRKSTLEKQVYAHTSKIVKATPRALCLQLRGNMKLWVERAINQSASVVRVSLQECSNNDPSGSKTVHPCINIAPELSCGLLTYAWRRIVSEVTGASIDELLESKKELDATVPCQELSRFLRLFEVEVLHITDTIREMRTLPAKIPEVAQLTAEFHNSLDGEQPCASLTILLSVLRSHNISADGLLVPLRTTTNANEFNAVQCIIKLNADLSTLPNVAWSTSTVKPLLGRIDANAVLQACKAAPSDASLREMLVAAVKACRR